MSEDGVACFGQRVERRWAGAAVLSTMSEGIGDMRCPGKDTDLRVTGETAWRMEYALQRSRQSIGASIDGGRETVNRGLQDEC